MLPRSGNKDFSLVDLRNRQIWGTNSLGCFGYIDGNLKHTLAFSYQMFIKHTFNSLEEENNFFSVEGQ